MKDFDFVIELGGSYVSIYKKNGGLVLKERSILAVNKNDEKLIIKAFGNEADKLEKINDPNIIVFSPFAEGLVKSQDYAKLLLSHFLKKANIKKSIFNALSCIVCIPCGLTEQDKKEYEKLMYSCNIENVVFIPSVYLIAINNGMKKHSKNNIIVDMGGSKTDVALVDYEGVRMGATLPLGSRNINPALSEELQQKYKLEIPLYLVEQLKIELSSLFENDISSMKIQVFEPNIDSTVTTIVYASDIKKVIVPYIDEIIKVIETTLNMLNDEELSWIKQNGILISGGMAKISGLEEYLKSKLGISVEIDENCDNSNIFGCAKLLKDKELLDIVLK